MGARPSARSRITRPDRRFGPGELAALPREERRKLAQVLLSDGPARVLEFQSTGAYDEFVLDVPLLWRSRRVRVRVADEVVDSTALTRLREAVYAASDAEGVLVAARGVAAGIGVPTGVMLVTPEMFIARLERSASIEWPDRTPRPASDRLALQRDLDRDAYLLDPVGLRWLPSLALNELPSDLAGDMAPEDLLERVAFRLFTSALGFRGERFGEATRGHRLPDAVLRWPTPGHPAALLDCKAASSGYTMAADHLLRFAEYAESLRDDLQAAGHKLRYMLILSSSFPGPQGGRHPFFGRAADLNERTGLRLVYLRADDLARTATSIEQRGLSTDARTALDWSTAFDHGLVTSEHLTSMLGD